MGKKKKKKNNIQEDVIKTMRKANREIELERNGGRWIAVNRPHKNKKKYDRKRDSKVDLESLYFFLQKTSNSSRHLQWWDELQTFLFNLLHFNRIFSKFMIFIIRKVSRD